MAQSSNCREQILASVHDLMASGGYNGFSYADVAASAGIRKQSVQHYFPTKKDLLEAYITQQCALTDAWIRTIQEDEPTSAAQLRRYVDEWKKSVSNALSPLCTYALLAAKLPLLPDDAANRIRVYFDLVTNWITSVLENGTRDGTIRLRAAPDVEAKIFMATVQGAFVSARAYDDESIFNVIVAMHFEHLDC